MEQITYGVDISKHNGLINWAEVDTNEVGFVIIRAGYGFSQADTAFKQNIEGALSRNIPVGVYWFSYAGTAEQAVREAKGCMNVIEPYRERLTLPVFFDWEQESLEYAKKQYGLNSTKATVTAMAKAFCDTLATAGYAAGVYSSKSYLETLFGDEVKSKHDVWVAHVRDGQGNPLEKTTYKGSYAIHQYSWVGHPRGFENSAGGVDMDKCYKAYGICQGSAASGSVAASAGAKAAADAGGKIWGVCHWCGSKPEAETLAKILGEGFAMVSKNGGQGAQG